MKLLTSYFYQIRFFTPNIIPLSTAVWDPKWYHNNQNQSYAYLDKNKVINGLRADIFVPNLSCNGLCHGVEECKSKDPRSCEFLKTYEMQLNLLDCDKVIEDLENLGNQIKSLFNFDGDPIICLMFHETPDNLCSERQVVQSFFRSNGYKINEFDKNS